MVHRGRGSCGLAFLAGLFYLALRCVLVERRGWVVRGGFCRVCGGLGWLVGGWCWMWRVGCAVAFRDVFLTCIVLMGTEFLIYSCVSCGTPGNTSVLVGYYLHW